MSPGGLKVHFRMAGLIGTYLVILRMFKQNSFVDQILLVT